MKHYKPTPHNVFHNAYCMAYGMAWAYGREAVKARGYTKAAWKRLPLVEKFAVLRASLSMTTPIVA